MTDPQYTHRAIRRTRVGGWVKPFQERGNQLGIACHAFAVHAQPPPPAHVVTLLRKARVQSRPLSSKRGEWGVGKGGRIWREGGGSLDHRMVATQLAPLPRRMDGKKQNVWHGNSPVTRYWRTEPAATGWHHQVGPTGISQQWFAGREDNKKGGGRG